MSRFIAGISAVLALGALTTGAAADVAPTPAARPASSTTSLASSATTRAPGAVPSPAAGSVTPSRIVCLNVSLQCFRVNSAAPGASGTLPPRSLDLRAPDIRTLVSEAELRRRVEDDWVLREREEEQQVRVEGARPDVYVPGGLASLPWAVMNPTQAWRIFLPVPASQTK